jgi:hypothetical protein
MRSPASVRDDMVTLYAVSGLTVRQIADRYGFTAWIVRVELEAAGVEFRPSGRQAVRPVEEPVAEASACASTPESEPEPAPAAPAAPAHTDLGPQPPRPVVELPDEDFRHIRAIRRANRGMGFPVLPIRGGF